MALFGGMTRARFGKDPREQAISNMQQPMPMPAPEREQRPAGFWQGGEKFGGRDALSGVMAVLGDAISNNYGSGAVGATQSLMGGRQSALNGLQAALAAEAERKNKFADWQRQYDYERANPKPSQPDDFDRSMARAGIEVGTPEYNRLASQYAQNKADPWVNVTTPQASFSGRQSQYTQYQQGSGGAPPGLTPMTPEDIEKLGLPQGGPASAPGGFHR